MKGSNKRKPRPRQTDAVQEGMIIALADKGLSSTKIATDIGVNGRAVRHLIERERIRRQAKAEPDRGDLSMSAQKKLDAALCAHKKKLEAEFHNRVNQRVREFLEETILPQHRKEQAQAQQIMHTRKGIMDKTSFRLIWSALHPDSRKSISDRKLAEAFDVFSRLEKLLLDEKQSPTDYQKLPRTMADWDKMREAARKTRSSFSSLRPR